MEEIAIEPKTELKAPREKKSSPKSDTIGLKIGLPLEASNRIVESFGILKERGYEGKIEDMMATLWEQVSQEWCESRIEALTPDEYYLNAIKLIPEVRQKLVDQAKKALLKVKDDSKN